MFGEQNSISKEKFSDLVLFPDPHQNLDLYNLDPRYGFEKFRFGQKIHGENFDERC